MKKILVTGGAGFIGSHLCERLVRQGHDVACLDDFSTGCAGNVEHLRSRPNFTLVPGDVRALDWRKLGLRPDEIYNLACPASPVAYQRDKVRTMLTNILGMLRVLETAVQCGGARVLQASTSEVYGDPETSEQSEDYPGRVNCVGPRACYDEGKRAAETLAFDYAKQNGLQVRVARIFNTYGPGMAEDDGRVVSNFIVQALRGESLTVYGSGEQTRSFCYVSDTVDGLIRVMEAENVDGPVNIGNPNEIKVAQLADMIAGMVGLPHHISRTVSRPLPTHDPKRRRPNIDKARRLGWWPHVRLRDGLERTIDYFRSRMEVAA